MGSAASGKTLTRQDSQDEVGPRAYQKLKQLGTGNCATVFLVRKKGTADLYAMKVVEKGDAMQKNKIKRVMTEKEILAHVDHPFIVRLYETFQSKGNLYFVLDYCAGGEFFDVLSKLPGGVLDENAAKFYAAEVLLALEYLHSQGYIYRDLKPENLLLHENGHIMLSDFDLSKSLDEKVGGSAGQHPEQPHIRHSGSSHGPVVDTEQRLKRCNSFVGTAEYISPEILLKQGYGSSVDWWTLGILIYEMIFGVTPFKGLERDDTFDNIRKGKFEFPSTPVVSKECKDVIKRLLEPNPEKRIGGAELKQHPWFRGVHFALIRNVQPPIIPQVHYEQDFLQALQRAEAQENSTNASSTMHHTQSHHSVAHTNSHHNGNHADSSSHYNNSNSNPNLHHSSSHHHHHHSNSQTFGSSTAPGALTMDKVDHMPEVDMRESLIMHDDESRSAANPFNQFSMSMHRPHAVDSPKVFALDTDHGSSGANSGPASPKPNLQHTASGSHFQPIARTGSNAGLFPEFKRTHSIGHGSNHGGSNPQLAGVIAANNVSRSNSQNGIPPPAHIRRQESIIE